MEPRRSNGAAPSSHPAPVASLRNGLGDQGSSGNLLNTVLIILLIITSVVATAYLVLRLTTDSGAQGAVKGKQYQALFLTNGQVYFGHISGVDSQYVKLTNIYYLQVQQQVQPGQQQNSSQQPNVSLAKLGNELHGPEDAMFVSRSQVLFWENLKNDGKVVQAITSYQSSHK